MTSVGRVLSVDRVTAKDGEGAWQVITDYAVQDADHLTRCACWLRRPGPVPRIGEIATWGHSLFDGAWAKWGSYPHRVKRIGEAFDPADQRLYTG